MKPFALLLAAAALLAAAPVKKALTGVISDEMCGKDHTMMNVKPDSKCVTECVKAGSSYVLVANGTVYKLSDQQSPAKFPAQKVKVTGTVDDQAHTIKVDSIAPAK